MWLQIILQEETAVPLQETAGLITADRVTVTPEITERDTEVIQGAITVVPVINLWVEVPGPTPLVQEAALQVTEVVLQATGEVHQA